MTEENPVPIHMEKKKKKILVSSKIANSLQFKKNFVYNFVLIFVSIIF